MDSYEKRLLIEYYELWRDCDALEASLGNADDYKNKVGEKQFDLIVKEFECKKTLFEILNQRVTDLGLIEKANKEGWRSYDNDFDDNDILDRQKVLSKACQDCYREMYAKSQPVGDYDEYVRQYKSGELRDDDKDRVYNRHYLSKEEYDYIIEKYIDAYGMKEKWSEYVDIVKSYFDKDAIKDKYIEEHTDDSGDYHPGHRGYEKLDHFKDVVAKILEQHIENVDIRNDVAKEIYDATMERIETCKNFYRFDREESGFHIEMALGASPTSNKDAVIEYWAKKGVDVEIVDRDPNTFWEKDMYGDDYENDCEDVEFEEVED